MARHERSAQSRNPYEPRREPVTTVNIYSSDLDRLRAHQRQLSFRKSDELGTKVWLSMAEIVRGLINAAEAKAEQGETADE
jgi:hypothetical protein